MPENQSNDVQAVLDRVTSNGGGNQESTEQETTETTEESTETTEESTSDGSTEESTEDKKSTNKDVAAFAAMRVANKKLQDRLDAYEAKETTETTEETTTEETTTEEKKPQYVIDLENEIKTLKQNQQTVMTEREQTIIASQLIQLRDEYSLTPEALYEFATDAEKKGINITDTHMTMTDAYRLVYHDKIIEAEVAKAKALIAGDSNPPGTGPTGTTGTGGSPKSMVDIISTLDDKLKK